MQAPIETKNVLFISPDTFGYYKAISAAIARKGFTPIWLNQLHATSVVSRVFFRLAPGIAKHLANGHFRRELAKIENVDLILIIKGEGVSEATIGLMRERYPRAKIVFYLWDSLRNVPGSDRKIDLSDAAFSFDPADCASDRRLTHLPLFHSKEPGSTVPKTGFAAFIGTLHSDRYRQIRMLGEEIEKTNGIKPFLYFYYPNRVLFAALKLFKKSFRKVHTANVRFVPVPREKYKAINDEAAILIDICHPRQSGLTMRTIEAMGEGKKLITNNRSVLQYDFFRAENCYLVDGPLGEDFGDFLHTPFQELSGELVAKYHIDSWLHTLLLSQHCAGEIVGTELDRTPADHIREAENSFGEESSADTRRAAFGNG